MHLFPLVLYLVSVTSQVSLSSPNSRPGGGGNVRVVGSIARVNPCGNGSDSTLRASTNPVATYWHGQGANISMNFGNLNSFWTMSIVTYTNYTGPIDPNATLPLPIASSTVTIRDEEQVRVTTNGSLNYVLRDFKWPLAAAAACRPNFYGCALRLVVTNSPAANETYFTCSDIRVYSRSFDSRLVFTVKMNPGVVPPDPPTMLTRIRAGYSTKGVTPGNSYIEPVSSFTLNSDGTFTFTLIISDTAGFNSERVVASISADQSTTLGQTLGVATVNLGPPPEEESGSGGTTAAIVIIILLVLLIAGGLIFVKVKKPATWTSWCNALSGCCKPAKGTNI